MTSGNIGRLRRLFVLSPLTVKQIIQDLHQYVHETGSTVDLILVGGLALQAYGFANRVTVDLDGELVGELNPLVRFIQSRHVPADLGENMSGWSVVAMPPGYRERTTVFHKEAGLTLRLLGAADFVIAKLRRGTEQGLDDAEFVANKFNITASEIRTSAGEALAASPQDTTLFLFNKTVEVFCKRI